MTERDDIKRRIEAAEGRRRARPGVHEQETLSEHDGPPPLRIEPPPLPLHDAGLDQDDGEQPTNIRGPSRIASAVPASEEALRVFDEMSAMRTFAGEHSVMETLPPQRGDRIVANQSQSDRSAMEAETAAFGPEDEGSGPLRTPSGEGGGPRYGIESGLFREAWLLFSHCPCPLFRMDTGGHILSANAAMLAFVGCGAEELEGSTLGDTRLGRNFPGLTTELQTCTFTGTPFQRILTFQADGAHTVRFMLWVVPIPDDVPTTASAAGIILPYPGGE